MDIEIREVRREDIPVLAVVLTEAFYADEYHAWLFPDALTRKERMIPYFDYRLKTSMKEGKAFTSTDLKCVAMAMHPDRPHFSFWGLVAWSFNIQRFFGFRANTIRRAVDLLDAHRPSRPHWYLEELAVEPEAQSKGYGRRMIEYIKELASGEKCPVYLEAANSDNLRYYEVLGFSKISEFRFPEDGPILYGLISPV